MQSSVYGPAACWRRSRLPAAGRRLRSSALAQPPKGGSQGWQPAKQGCRKKGTQPFVSPPSTVLICAQVGDKIVSAKITAGEQNLVLPK